MNADCSLIINPNFNIVNLPVKIVHDVSCHYIASTAPGWTTAFYGAPTSTAAKLQRVHNCLVRIVLQRRKSCHAQPLLESLHWLPISHQINFKLATLAYKVQSTSQLTYLHQLIPRQFTGSSVSLCSPKRPLLQVPRTRTAYGSRAFSGAVPNVWNKLPADAGPTT